ncbi:MULTISPECIES: hypothetical protein [unclassified Arthrobacter]|uniref:hypothetical protein n=1 Tax=unclassified Arthrobacter TaxID=235627 RepID=UPI00138AB461|nr:MULTISPECIES: hypothetical protein [unclassified Arthrobacter]
MGQFMLLSDGQAEKFGPLTTLAATYVGHELNVKFKQYAHVHDGLNEALFSSKHLGTILLEALGFTYEDFLAIREAIRSIYLDRFFAARDILGDVAQEWETDGRNDQSPEALSKVEPPFTISCSFQESVRVSPRERSPMHHQCQKTA